jgi:hypothetical protein
MPSIMPHRLPIAVAMLILAGCTARPAPEAPPQGVDRIAIEAPVNRTGRDVVTEDPGIVGTLLKEKRATLPKTLAEDLRLALVDRGFKIIGARSTSSPTLRTEITR